MGSQLSPFPSLGGCFTRPILNERVDTVSADSILTDTVSMVLVGPM